VARGNTGLVFHLLREEAVKKIHGRWASRNCSSRDGKIPHAPAPWTRKCAPGELLCSWMRMTAWFERVHVPPPALHRAEGCRGVGDSSASRWRRPGRNLPLYDEAILALRCRGYSLDDLRSSALDEFEKRDSNEGESFRACRPACAGMRTRVCDVRAG